MAKLKMEVGLIWKMNRDTIVLDIISTHCFVWFAGDYI